MKKNMLLCVVMAVVTTTFWGQCASAQAFNAVGATPALTVIADPASAGKGNVSIGSIPGGDNSANPAKSVFVDENVLVSSGYVKLFKQVPGSYLASITGLKKLTERDALTAVVLYGCYGKEYYTDATGAVTGIGSPADFSLAMQYSRKFGSFSAAIGPHISYSDRGNGESGAAFAADVSLYYQSINGAGSCFSAGLSLQNIGTPITYAQSKVKAFLPSTAGFGIGYTSSSDDNNHFLSIGIDVVKSLLSNASPDSIGLIQSLVHPNNDIRYGIGLQYMVTGEKDRSGKTENAVSLRCGYVGGTYLNAAGVTFGAGGLYRGVGVNASYLLATTDVPVSQTFRFGLVFAF